MNALTFSFTELFNYFSQKYEVHEIQVSSRSELSKNIPAHIRGVYSFWAKKSNHPIYIGCAGKISRNKKDVGDQSIILRGNDVKKRLSYASTPYHFSKELDILFYSPTTAKVKPEGYHSQISLNEIIIKIICIDDITSPAALEHLLIQGYINEFGNLPLANQAL
jgi:hypothetical protein